MNVDEQYPPPGAQTAEDLLRIWKESRPGGTLCSNIDPCICEGSCNSSFVDQTKIIAFEDYGLSGTLPSELGKLTKLTDIGLHANRISGTLPKELSHIDGFEYLDIDDNKISGTIPADYMGLDELISLYLKDNLISGTIQSTMLPHLRTLANFFLHRNKFSGTLPSEIGSMRQLHYLGFEGNVLSGTVPTQVGQLQMLNYLQLNGNHFSGTVPTELNELKLELCLLVNSQVPFGHPGHMISHGPATNSFTCPLPKFTNECGTGLVANMSVPINERGVDFCEPSPPLEPKDPKQRDASLPNEKASLPFGLPWSEHSSASDIRLSGEGAISSVTLLQFSAGFGGALLVTAVGIFLGLSWARRHKSRRAVAASPSSRVEMQRISPPQVDALSSSAWQTMGQYASG